MCVCIPVDRSSYLSPGHFLSMSHEFLWNSLPSRLWSCYVKPSRTSAGSVCLCAAALPGSLLIEIGKIDVALSEGMERGGGGELESCLCVYETSISLHNSRSPM